MADLHNFQRVLGVRVVDDGTVIHNGQLVLGVTIAGESDVFAGNIRVVGVDVLDADAVIHNEQPVLGVVVIDDGRKIYNGMLVVPAYAVSGRLNFWPIDLTPAVWLEPARGGLFQSNAGTTAASANGNVVGYLPDLSGDGKHYTSVADDTTRPTLQGVGTLPCLRFDGVNDVLHRPSSLGLYAAGAYTMAFALKGNSPATDARVFAEGNTATNNTLFIPLQTSASIASSSALMYRNDAGVQQTGSLTNANVFNGSNHVLNLTDDGTTIRSYLDGVAGPTLNYSRGTYTLDRSAIGALMRAATSNWWAGDLYGLVAVSRVVTDAERSRLTKYMGNLAGLSL